MNYKKRGVKELAKRYGRGGTWGGKLTGLEKGIGGTLFLAYLTVLPFLSSWIWTFLDDKFSIWYSDAAEREIYYAILSIILFFVFWSLLKNGVNALLGELGINLIGFLAGLSGAVLGEILISRIPLPVVDPTTLTYMQQYRYQPAATIAVLVFLLPIVEELFFRGLVFGWIRNHSRSLAYVVSCLLFCLSGVWQYAFTYGDLRYLLLAVRLLPTSIALCWCYDTGGSIWSPMALHMTLNAIDLFGTVSF